MNPSAANAGADTFESQRVAPAVLPATRPLYWSIRRELWEHRSIYVGPVAVTVVFLFGFLVSLIGLPHKMQALSALGPEQQHAAIITHYSILAGLLMLTQMLIGAFYCLDAFSSERRDRSILFWKSLPVSDFTAVLAKASIPLCVLPLLTVALTVAAQFVMLLLSTAALSGNGQSIHLLWTNVSWLRSSLMVLYHIVAVHTLWQAPLYGFLLLVSAWARRAGYLWAVLPPLAIVFLEKIMLGTSYFADFLLYRLGSGTDSVAPDGYMPIDPMTHLTPWNFVTTPGLWIGLGVTAAFLLAAARLRRYREPI